MSGNGLTRQRADVNAIRAFAQQKEEQDAAKRADAKKAARAAATQAARQAAAAAPKQYGLTPGEVPALGKQVRDALKRLLERTGPEKLAHEPY